VSGNKENRRGTTIPREKKKKELNTVEKPSPKPTEAEYQKRIEIIKLAIIDGKTRYMLLQYAAKNWGIKDRALDGLIARASKEIEDDYAPTKKRELGKHIARREQLFSKAKEKEDYRLALAVDDSTAKLKGLMVEHAFDIPPGKKLVIEDED
jgi:hypothetical protein